jgi:hypothetical protein
MAAITTCLLCGTTLTDMEAALADLKVLHVAARAMFRDLHKVDLPRNAVEEDFRCDSRRICVNCGTAG